MVMPYGEHLRYCTSIQTHKRSKVGLSVYKHFERKLLLILPAYAHENSAKNGVEHNRLWFWIQVIDMLIDLLTLNSYSTADTKRQIAINIENVLSKQKLVNQTKLKYLGYMIRNLEA